MFILLRLRPECVVTARRMFTLLGTDLLNFSGTTLEAPCWVTFTDRKFLCTGCSIQGMGLFDCEVCKRD